MSSSQNWPCAALARADLADRTTMRVGGRVEWLLEPATPDEFVAAFAACRERGVATRVLGGGANLLVDDGMLGGAVLTTSRMNRLFRAPLDGEVSGALTGEEADLARVAPRDRTTNPRFVAWAGATMPAIVRAASELGWTGLEGLAGVPGNLGGGVAMNAGGRWGDMWDVIERVRVVDPDGGVRDLLRADCTPRYRDGGLGASIVLGAVLAFRVEDSARVKQRVREYLLEKRRIQPVTEWSAGCIFKNPPKETSDGRSAGKLIEDAGCKGLARGDAIVSELHGNFIVNRGAASAADVFTLIEDVRDRVAQKTTVRLETEVKVWR
ncbi:MAG: FAD-binding protein [Planctomycetes bacterium]|nr:FAD-binding protein [Planctomycetota bacterium]